MTPATLEKPTFVWGVSATTFSGHTGKDGSNAQAALQDTQDAIRLPGDGRVGKKRFL